MFNFELINSPNFKINTDIIKSIFEIISLDVNKLQNGTLNIVFVTPNEIKEFNKNYRWKDYVTDVLSFHYYDSFDNLKNYDIAWELVFCEEKILLQASEYGLGDEKEFYKLLIHSILHILWYDHESDQDYESMNNLEDKIWHEVFKN